MNLECHEGSERLAILHEFISASMHDEATDTQIAEIEQLLRESEEARQLYADLIEISVYLPRVLVGVFPEDAGEQSRVGEAAKFPPNPCFLAPSPPLLSPLSSLPSFIGSPLFSYLVAALIVGLGLLIASAWKMSESPEIARQPLPPAGQRVREPEPTLEFVGRITGMVDCRWADASTAILDRTNVRLGRRFALASGLMEITYGTGAKVILQGPVTYEVDANGGYLTVGKLTGKLEKKNDEARMTNDEGKPEIRTRNDEKLQNSSFVIRPSSFVIRTPTATVTDLGTEFGVEVDGHGDTTSCVFRGSIRLQVAGVDEMAQSASRVLRENESARVEKSGGGHPAIVLGASAKPADFVRDIRAMATKTFDLVDVVAGGDGFSNRRNGGIDPASGQATDTRPKDPGGVPTIGDGKYHRVRALPFVDGVFIPDGSSGPVQTDSAGHVFDGFLATSNQTALFVWAGGQVSTEPSLVIPTELDGVDYASSGHGLLFMHANQGITFDLQPIRRANPNFKLKRFRAVAGNLETQSEKDNAVYADLWVLVDGRSRFQCRQICRYNGAFSVAVALNENDRFLTLAATDGGNGIGADWTIFGDPRLELVPVGAGAKQDVTKH